MKRRISPTRRARERAAKARRLTAISTNRGDGTIETVLVVHEPVRARHAPHIAALVARYHRSRKDGTS